MDARMRASTHAFSGPPARTHACTRRGGGFACAHDGLASGPAGRHPRGGGPQGPGTRAAGGLGAAGAVVRGARRAPGREAQAE
eukprot:4835965-Alexandrium_andersonii.AAC.1